MSRWKIIFLLPNLLMVSCACYLQGSPVIWTNSNPYDDRPNESFTGIALSEADSQQLEQATDGVINNAWEWVINQAKDLTTGWHLKRNRNNILPSGRLRPKTNATSDYVYNPKSDNAYVDDNRLEWKLLPDYLNEFHQPEGHGDTDNPYPNKKFIYREGVASSEVILQPPDWTPLTEGELQGTYNYVDAGGYFGKIMNRPSEAWSQVWHDPASAGEDILRDVGHFFADMLPHWISSDYQF